MSTMVREHLSEVIKEAVKSAYDQEVTPDITYVDAKFGDFATNVAFALARTLKKPPKEIASELAPRIKSPRIASARAAGSGFINISMSEGFWAE